MDKNKNKNKTNVLRSSRIIKIKATGVNTNSNYASSITSLSNSQPEEVNLPLQKLSTLSTLLKLQDSDLQILSNILRKTANGLKIVLDQQLLRVLTDPNINKWTIGDVLSDMLSSDIKKIKERLLSLLTFAATSNEKVVLKKLNDELSKPLTTVEIIEINRNLLLIVYYYSK